MKKEIWIALLIAIAQPILIVYHYGLVQELNENPCQLCNERGGSSGCDLIDWNKPFEPLPSEYGAGESNQRSERVP